MLFGAREPVALVVVSEPPEKAGLGRGTFGKGAGGAAAVGAVVVGAVVVGAVVSMDGAGRFSIHSKVPVMPAPRAQMAVSAVKKGLWIFIG